MFQDVELPVLYCCYTNNMSPEDTLSSLWSLDKTFDIILINKALTGLSDNLQTNRTYKQSFN